MNSINILTITVIILFSILYLINTRTTKKIKKEFEYLKKLKESIVLSLPIGVHIYNKHGLLIDLNNTSLKILGISSKEEYLGSQINIFENSFIPQYLKDAILVKKQCSGNFQINFNDPYITNRYISTTNKGIKYFSGIGKQVIDESGNILYYILIFADISEQVRSIKELEIIREKAEQSEKIKSAFISNMSHEIRTPLNSIIGFSELLVDGNFKNEELKKEYMSIIKHNNKVLLHFFNNILNLSNIESNKINLNLKKHELTALFSKWINYAKDTFKEKQIEVLANIGDAPEYIVTDNIHINEVLTNFINNAKKFTTQGSVILGYRWSKTHKSVYFFVRDSGIGILSEHIPYVFDRFYKINSFIPGLGLGLTINKCIIENLHGRIGVKSIYGKGSEFWFTLPCKIV